MEHILCGDYALGMKGCHSPSDCAEAVVAVERLLMRLLGGRRRSLLTIMSCSTKREGGLSEVFDRVGESQVAYKRGG
jgi:hypothetical protein